MCRMYCDYNNMYVKPGLFSLGGLCGCNTCTEAYVPLSGDAPQDAY